MSTVTVHEAKTHLSRLIKQVLAGEEVLIAPRGKQAVVKLVVAEPAVKSKRVLGHLAHHVQPGDDPLAHGFWDPLPDEELDLWEGKFEKAWEKDIS